MTGTTDDPIRPDARPRDDRETALTFRTRTVHAGQPDGPVHPVSMPIVPGTTVADAAVADTVAMTGQPLDARDGMPGVLAREGAVAKLEGAATAYAVPSGVAAISLTLLALLPTGDHVVVNAGGYQDTLSRVDGHLARFGIDATLTAATAPP